MPYAYSVVASFTGELESVHGSQPWAESPTLDDIERYTADCDGLSYERGDPGRSEYAYMADGGDVDCSAWPWTALARAHDEQAERVARWLYKRYDEGSDAWWGTLADAHVSGIVKSADALRTWLEMIGASPSGCETMGTLGGPLSLGCVADIDWQTDGRDLLSSIRITPFYVDLDGEPLPAQARREVWDRIARVHTAFLDPWA